MMGKKPAILRYQRYSRIFWRNQLPARATVVAPAPLVKNGSIPEIALRNNSSRLAGSLEVQNSFCQSFPDFIVACFWRAFSSAITAGFSKRLRCASKNAFRTSEPFMRFLAGICCWLSVFIVTSPGGACSSLLRTSAGALEVPLGSSPVPRPGR